MRRMSLTSRAVHCSSTAISSGGRLAAERLHQLALDVDDLVELLDHVHRDADRARLVGDRPRDRLADPPGRVGRELVAAAVVELLDRADQPERALLDQVQERQPAAEVALRDRHDEAQVGLDHLLLGGHVAALDALRQRDLLVGGQQVHAADRAQVQPQRVEARLDRQVDLRLLRRRLAAASEPAGCAVGRRRPRRLAPSAATTSMPFSTRCACRSRTCSFVTSTSSRHPAISSKVRYPRSRALGHQRAQLLDLEERRRRRSANSATASFSLNPRSFERVCSACDGRLSSRPSVSHSYVRCPAFAMYTARG